MVNRILAAIDVGTNSIHMVVVRIQPELPAFTIIAKERATVRLGDRDPETGDLTQEAMERATKALRRCQTLAHSLNVEAILAVATSAVRETSNGPDFLRRIKKDLGLDINLIAGVEEARRIYLGVLSGMEFQGRPHVIIDIGGGSTELILGAGYEPRSLSSTKVGAVRLSALFVTSDPISSGDFKAMQAYIRGLLEEPTRVLRENLSPGETPVLVGTSGTIEAVASLLAYEASGEVPERLGGHTVSLNAIQELIQRLRKLNNAERAALPGMSERRAEIIVAGALILQEAMILLQLDEISVCERALREGIVVDWMLSHGLIDDRLRYQNSVRQRSVLHAAHKFRTHRAHGDRVAEFAVTLFDQLQGSLHDWDEAARDLLWAAATLHDVGSFISNAAYHKHSYYLIRYGELLGYTEPEIETIANLARYHRKSPPKPKHDNYKRLMDKTYRQMVDQLHPILRLAVAMDRRKLGAIALVRCELDPGLNRLSLHLKPNNLQDDCILELWSLEQNKTEFEKAFKLEVALLLDPEG
ncbi:MAG: Ppx/GppA family phosphatase [Synechococcales cyanobacterium CRU_2_2]|nr:Ppx/GppA family phosphatase [Synechococcales cyanobacterium CRU_2_2]